MPDSPESNERAPPEVAVVQPIPIVHLLQGRPVFQALDQQMFDQDANRQIVPNRDLIPVQPVAPRHEPPVAHAAAPDLPAPISQLEIAVVPCDGPTGPRIRVVHPAPVPMDVSSSVTPAACMGATFFAASQIPMDVNPVETDVEAGLLATLPDPLEVEILNNDEEERVVLVVRPPTGHSERSPCLEDQSQVVSQDDRVDDEEVSTHDHCYSSGPPSEHDIAGLVRLLKISRKKEAENIRKLRVLIPPRDRCPTERDFLELDLSRVELDADEGLAYLDLAGLTRGALGVFCSKALRTFESRSTSISSVSHQEIMDLRAERLKDPGEVDEPAQTVNLGSFGPTLAYHDGYVEFKSFENMLSGLTADSSPAKRILVAERARKRRASLFPRPGEMTLSNCDLGKSSDESIPSSPETRRQQKPALASTSQATVPTKKGRNAKLGEKEKSSIASAKKSTHLPSAQLGPTPQEIIKSLQYFALSCDPLETRIDGVAAQASSVETKEVMRYLRRTSSKPVTGNSLADAYPLYLLDNGDPKGGPKHGHRPALLYALDGSRYSGHDDKRPVARIMKLIAQHINDGPFDGPNAYVMFQSALTGDAWKFVERYDHIETPLRFVWSAFGRLFNSQFALDFRFFQTQLHSLSLDRPGDWNAFFIRAGELCHAHALRVKETGDKRDISVLYVERFRDTVIQTLLRSAPEGANMILVKEAYIREKWATAMRSLRVLRRSPAECEYEYHPTLTLVRLTLDEFSGPANPGGPGDTSPAEQLPVVVDVDTSDSVDSGADNPSIIEISALEAEPTTPSKPSRKKAKNAKFHEKRRRALPKKSGPTGSDVTMSAAAAVPPPAQVKKSARLLRAHSANEKTQPKLLEKEEAETTRSVILDKRPAAKSTAPEICLLCGKHGHGYAVCRSYPSATPIHTSCDGCGYYHPLPCRAGKKSTRRSVPSRAAKLE